MPPTLDGIPITTALCIIAYRYVQGSTDNPLIQWYIVARRVSPAGVVQKVRFIGCIPQPVRTGYAMFTSVTWVKTDNAKARTLFKSMVERTKDVLCI